MKKLSFNIIGAGAIGHLWASFLSLHGFNVQLYSRVSQLKKEFEINSPLGQFKQTIEYATIEHWKDADVTLICVKAHQLEQLCLQLAQLKINDTQIILMMNGLGLVEIVEQHLMKPLHASMVHGVYINNNQIIHTGMGKTTLGNLNSTFNPKLMDELVNQLNFAFPKVIWNEQHQQAMNLKLIINSIINPITALNNQPNDSVLLANQLNPTAEMLLIELKPLLNKLLPTMQYQSIKQQVELVAINTKRNISSMLQDVRANKETEIDFINGYLVKLAQSQQVDLPQHKDIIIKIKLLSSAD